MFGVINFKRRVLKRKLRRYNAIDQNKQTATMDIDANNNNEEGCVADQGIDLFDRKEFDEVPDGKIAR